MRFPQRISICGNSRATLTRGGPGGPTPPCIYGKQASDDDTHTVKGIHGIWGRHNCLRLRIFRQSHPWYALDRPAIAKAIWHIEFPKEKEKPVPPEADWKPSSRGPVAEAARQLREYFAGRRTEFDFAAEAGRHAVPRKMSGAICRTSLTEKPFTLRRTGASWWAILMLHVPWGRRTAPIPFRS